MTLHALKVLGIQVVDRRRWQRVQGSGSTVKSVIFIRSTPTYLRFIADQTRSKYDQPKLYRRPSRSTPRSTYDLWRAESSPTIFQLVEKIIPLTTTSQSEHDQPRLYFRPTYALTDQGPLIADPSIFTERETAGMAQVSGASGA